MNLYEAPEYTEEAEQELTYDEYIEYKEGYTRIVTLGKSANKLVSIPEFKTLIMEAYLTEEPARIGSFMASGKMTDGGIKTAAEDLKAIGLFRNFLQSFILQANDAQVSLDNLELAYQESLDAAEAAKEE